MHDIEFVSPEIVRNEAIPCLQALKQEGKVKYIGVTGYLLKMFQQVTYYTSIDSILSYCRFTLHDSSLKSLLPELRAKGIGVINASLTGMEILTERGALIIRKTLSITSTGLTNHLMKACWQKYKVFLRQLTAQSGKPV